MKLQFTKMEGLGNDYVYMDYTKREEPKDIPSLAQFISNRHFGIGADGLILICKSQKADFTMKMFNADGSQAQMCGNGIRCVGKFVYEKGLTNQTTITIETLAGIKTLVLQTKDGKVEKVTVNMGEPILDPKLIPVKVEQMPVMDLKITAEDTEFELSCVSMGNPHAVTVVPQVNEFPVEKYGKVLEKENHFPEKANIEFIQVQDRSHIKMRVWERGSGETLACGTGACAATVACILKKLVENKVTVELLGGNLEIEWNKEDNHVYMTGPARMVFEGEIEYNKEEI